MRDERSKIDKNTIRKITTSDGTAAAGVEVEVVVEDVVVLNIKLSVGWHLCKNLSQSKSFLQHTFVSDSQKLSCFTQLSECSTNDSIVHPNGGMHPV